MQVSVRVWVSALILISGIACASKTLRAALDERQAPERPPIIGVSHIGVRTDNLAAARKFYTGVLGLSEAFSLDDPPGKMPLTYFKVNDHQFIEVFPS